MCGLHFISHIILPSGQSITTGSDFQRVGGMIGSKSFCPPSLVILQSLSLAEIHDRFGSEFQTRKLTTKNTACVCTFLKYTLGKICTGNQSRKLSSVITKPRDKSHINFIYLSKHLFLFLSLYSCLCFP